MGEKTGGCLIWTKSHFASGYGRIYLAGKSRRVHRVSWALANGREPMEGLVVAHAVCHRRPCFLPTHLQETTQLENLLQSPTTMASISRSRTHCRKCGQPMSGDNLYIAPNGNSHCRFCDRERAKLYSRRRYKLVREKRIAAGLLVHASMHD